jgi:hypothetical protein
MAEGDWMTVTGKAETDQPNLTVFHQGHLRPSCDRALLHLQLRPGYEGQNLRFGRQLCHFSRTVHGSGVIKRR